MKLLAIANKWEKYLAKTAANNYLQLNKVFEDAKKLSELTDTDMYGYVNVSPFVNSIFQQAKNALWKAYSQGMDGAEMADFKGTVMDACSNIDSKLEMDSPDDSFTMAYSNLKADLGMLVDTTIPKQKPEPATEPEPAAEEGLGSAYTMQEDLDEENPYSPYFKGRGPYSGQD